MNKKQTSKMLVGALMLGLTLYTAGDSYAQMSMTTGKAEVPHGVIEQLNPVYDAYFNFQEALANDNFQEAKSSLNKLEASVQKAEFNELEEAARSEWAAIEERLVRNASLGQEAQTIDELRTNVLKDLSEAVLELEKEFGHSASRTHYEAFCPMALNTGASWLQKGEQVMNPFYGKNMQGCGELKAEFPARG